MRDPNSTTSHSLSQGTGVIIRVIRIICMYIFLSSYRRPISTGHGFLTSVLFHSENGKESQSLPKLHIFKRLLAYSMLYSSKFTTFSCILMTAL
jgi:hypothetical protein